MPSCSAVWVIRQRPLRHRFNQRNRRTLADAERLALLDALERQRWHMTHTAEQLGISRNTLYRKLRKHAIAR